VSIGADSLGPGLLTAMLYGSVDERLGEKFVLALSMLGYAVMQMLDMFICTFTEMV
jgi:hypothetical protein